MASGKVPSECLRYYNLGYKKGYEEATRRFCRLTGYTEHHLRRLTKRLKYRMLKIVYFEFKEDELIPEDLRAWARIARHEVRGFTGNDYERWDSTFYIRSDLGRIGKMMVFLHELFHYLLTWTEWRKQRRIFPEELKDTWEHLWKLQFRKTLRSLREVFR